MKQGTSGVELISTERARQMFDEGWTAQHDDEHDGRELALAASCYLAVHVIRPIGAKGMMRGKPYAWPWEAKHWKPSDDPIRNLVKVGALVAAEIDRLQRLEEKK